MAASKDPTAGAALAGRAGGTGRRRLGDDYPSEYARVRRKLAHVAEEAVDTAVDILRHSPNDLARVQAARWLVSHLVQPEAKELKVESTQRRYHAIAILDATSGAELALPPAGLNGHGPDPDPAHGAGAAAAERAVGTLVLPDDRAADRSFGLAPDGDGLPAGGS